MPGPGAVPAAAAAPGEVAGGLQWPGPSRGQVAGPGVLRVPPTAAGEAPLGLRGRGGGSRDRAWAVDELIPCSEKEYSAVPLLCFFFFLSFSLYLFFLFLLEKKKKRHFLGAT